MQLSRRDLLAGAVVLGVAPPAAPVAIAKVSGYHQDLVVEFERMFDHLGGVGSLVRGKTVALKLNLTGAGRKGRRPDEHPGTTHWVHPNVAGALAAVFAKLGARRVRLLESSFGNRRDAPLEETLLAAGWDARAVKSAAPLVEFEDTNGLGQGKRYATLRVRARRPYVFPAFSLNHSYEDCDFFVSVAKMKNHEEMGLSLSMKNLLGTTPEILYGRAARKRIFHYGQARPPAGVPQEIDSASNRYEGWRLPRIMADLCGARPVDLAVIDGIEALIGGENPEAPGARPGQPGLLVAGRNCVCTDAVAAAAMGYNPREGRHAPPFRLDKDPRGRPREQLVPPEEPHQYADNPMLLGEAAGIGSADLGRIDVRGVPLRDAIYDYQEPWKGPEKG